MPESFLIQLQACHWSLSIPLENIRYFQGAWKETSGRLATLFKTLVHVFSCEFCKITFFTEHLRTGASEKAYHFHICEFMNAT